MKTYKFENGTKILESQFREGSTIKETSILCGLFDKKTLKPLPYVTYETTKEELRKEELRLAKLENEYLDICEKNAKIATENENVANATNIDEFLNAYL